MATVCGPVAVALATVVAMGALRSPSSHAATELSTNAFTAVSPVRLADTRGGFGGFERLDRHTIDVPVRGRLPIDDSNATAVVVTVTIEADHGFATAYPSDGALPVASTVNATPGASANSATTITALGADGALNVYTSDVDAVIIVDISGVFTPASTSRSGRYVPISPTRTLDTRVDRAPIGEAGTIRVPNPAGVPGDAVALAVNVTAIPTNSFGGFASLYPAGTSRPEVSQLSAAGPGQARAAGGIVPVNGDGFDIYSTFGGHFVVDVVGYFTGPSAADDTIGLFVALPSPVRRIDTRERGPLHPGGAIEVAIPTPGSSMTGTITVTDAAGWGFVSAYASGTPIPDTSTVNTNQRGETVANFVLSAISERGVAAFSVGRTHVIVDQTGYFTGPAATATLPPATNDAPLPTYPTGRCDTIAPGMEALALPPNQRPADVVQIGVSVQGRAIWAEYWGPPQASDIVLVISQIHGNECSVNRMTKAIREDPPTGYGIWLIPTLNPDGYALGTRHNSNGIDLNADGGAVSQPETQALMAFSQQIRPTLSIHVHFPNGFVGWFGRNRYVLGDPNASAAVLSSSIAADISTGTAMGYSGAGARSTPANWFLWQGQQQVHSQEALLLELFAVADNEVPSAIPRPRTRSVAEVDAHIARTLVALDEHL